MKFKNLFLFAAIAIVASCGKYQFDATQVNQEISLQRAKNQLGVEIDPNQNWRPIRHGSVTITANAELENIVKVQLLTESPFGNEDAEILASKDCSAGQQVTLTYEAPDYLTELVAACVNNKGVYYIKVFDIENTSVDFNQGANARNRASVFDNYPSEIILGSCIKSFNAERAEASMNSEYHNFMSHETPGGGGTHRYYDNWKDGSWANDRLWDHQRVAGDGGWAIDGGTISRKVSDEGDMQTIKGIVTGYLKKTGGAIKTNGTNKSNNWASSAASNEYFTGYGNCIVSDGTPTVLVPLQMWTTEGHFNTIYYYYYDPAKVTSADDIKRLPKFRAINGFAGGNNFSRTKEYLLPYYGDNPAEGTWASPAIPAGYMIGFLNRKDFNNAGDVSSSGSGCTYGDGRLNLEVNHLVGHYFSAMSTDLSQLIRYDKADGSKTQTVNGKTPQGMDFESPRIAVFSANDRTYLCFEDGADCNFCDMIVEVKQGNKILESTESPSVRTVAYTMCFEDRPNEADYDMNDVVLTAKRASDTEITLTLLACGAKDHVTLHNTNSAFEGREIHELLGLSDDSPYYNTVIGGNHGAGTSTNVTVDSKTTIEDYLAGIYIINRVSGQDIRFPGQGNAPSVIIVPANFNYPKEGTSIIKSYPNFLEWAADVNASKDWYRSTEGVDRYPLLFLNQ